MNYKGDERYKPISFVVDDLLFKQKCTKNNCEAHEKTAMLLKEFDNTIQLYRMMLFDASLNRSIELSAHNEDIIMRIISDNFNPYRLVLRLSVVNKLILTEKFILDSSNECINKALKLLYEENDSKSIEESYRFLFRRMLTSHGSCKKKSYFDNVKYNCFKDIIIVLKEKDPIIRLKKLYSKKNLTFETLEIVCPEAIKVIEKIYYDHGGLGGNKDD